MKETYNNIKEEVLHIGRDLSAVLSAVMEQTDIAEERFSEWSRSCEDIHDQISEEVIRVAVIGTVKSGKSTLVNSLFGGDYVKRGAGVVTSIVTRIRRGDGLSAVVYFKSWDEVNSDIAQALLMLPTWNRQADDAPFDIRRERDRRALQSALSALNEDLLVTEGVRNTNIVLLSLYMKGYNMVMDRISAESMTAVFSGEQFGEHRAFVAADALAVYLKDIELEISDNRIDRSIEIADCQGSDSPNPLHLAMIQDYLLKTHFIVYVISSRTGLRQADIRFLSMIRQMGILGNIIFVVNIDFSEHESLQDLQTLVDKIREELSLVRPDPDIYVFSALYSLFRTLEDSLAGKDKLRLEQWQADKDLTGLADRDQARFDTALNEKLTKDRFALLLKNHLERIDVMVSGVERWARMNRELLEKDANGVSSAIKKMEHRQKRMDQIQALVSNTLSGARSDLMKELRKDIDRFFNPHTGDLLEQTSAFVNKYTVASDTYRDKVAASGFSNTLYSVFQEFKQALDTFMTESLNPKIARFTVEVEERIRKALESAAEPFHSIALDDIAELRAFVHSTGGNGSPAAGASKRLVDLAVLKRVAGITLPSSRATLQYYARMRAESMVRLGLYSVKNFFRKAIKKDQGTDHNEQVQALEDGIRLMKRETEKAIVFHFENYRENFKFQYAAKLIDAVSANLHQVLMEQYQSYNTDIRTIEKMIEKKGRDRQEMIDFFERTADTSRDLQMKVEKARTML